VDGHIDLADLERLADEVQASGGRGLGQGLGGEGSGHDRAAAALAESYRLQGIVNNTLASLIDVSLRCVCLGVDRCVAARCIQRALLSTAVRTLLHVF